MASLSLSLKKYQEVCKRNKTSSVRGRLFGWHDNHRSRAVDAGRTRENAIPVLAFLRAGRNEDEDEDEE